MRRRDRSMTPSVRRYLCLCLKSSKQNVSQAFTIALYAISLYTISSSDTRFLRTWRVISESLEFRSSLTQQSMINRSEFARGCDRRLDGDLWRFTTNCDDNDSIIRRVPRSHTWCIRAILFTSQRALKDGLISMRSWRSRRMTDVSEP